MKRRLVLAGLALAGGLIASQAARAVPKDAAYAKLGVFARVLSYIENNYVEDVDHDRLMYGAVQGLVSTLDPHTSFMTPAQYRDMKEDTDGRFGGIGLEVEKRGGRLTVVAAIDGTPAARGGLLAGDVILAIDDTRTDTIEREEAAHRLRGPKGTRVRLLVQRSGWTEPREHVIVRDLIRIVAVESRALTPGFGYVRVKTFQEGVHRSIDDAIDRLEESRGGLQGLVLDLRDNPGGLLDEAVRVADLFLDSGVIVKTRGKGGRTLEEEHAHPRGTRKAFPLVVLANGGTASASEIVAGALQDHKRAVILGTQTFGKGSVQTIIEMDDGSALKLTVARYYTPSGRSIQESGIRPDIIVEQRDPGHPQDGQREKDLARHLKPEPTAARDRGQPVVAPDDLQLQTAYDYLRSLDVLRASSTTGG